MAPDARRRVVPRASEPPTTEAARNHPAEPPRKKPMSRPEPPSEPPGTNAPGKRGVPSPSIGGNHPAPTSQSAKIAPSRELARASAGPPLLMLQRQAAAAHSDPGGDCARGSLSPPLGYAAPPGSSTDCLNPDGRTGV